MHVDVVIFGGGAAGLWTLDRLVRAGCICCLLEAGRLGQGQTIASQGIIHGGLKYTLAGMLTRSASSVRDMPAVWRDALAGRRAPDLSNTRIRSECCYLWRTDSVSSRLGLIGAHYGLSVSAEDLQDAARPSLLARCPGTVARLPEQVIAPESLLGDLAQQHRRHILAIDAAQGMEFAVSRPGRIEAIHLAEPRGTRSLTLTPRQVIFAAGAGNAALRERAGLTRQAMQRRPLHMVLVRGCLPGSDILPQLNGHCVDGAKTRVTITANRDAQGRTVWQLGGQLAEDGVAMNAEQLTIHARHELAATIPGIDLGNIEWATYRVDRAELCTPHGGRPDSFALLHEENTLTAWPTKLALVPLLAESIAERVLPPASTATQGESPFPVDWPRPEVALPPWEIETAWSRVEERGGEKRAAA